MCLACGQAKRKGCELTKDGGSIQGCMEERFGKSTKDFKIGKES
jgi:hypothetical protein